MSERAALVAAPAIAYVGPLSGDFAQVGEGLCRSIRIALRHVADDGLLDDPVALREHDSGGRPEAAAELARRIVDDESVVAVVGPTFSRETEAAGDILDAARVPFVVPVATKPELGARGWSSFFRIVASDAIRAPLTAVFMGNELGATRAAVVRDESDSGRRLAELLAGALDEAGVAVVHRAKLSRDDDSFLEAARAVVESSADAVYFAGEYREAGLLRRELVRLRGPSIFVSDDGVLTPEFVSVAGAAADGALVTFPGADAETAAPRLARDSRSEHGMRPAAFATEAYGAASLVLRALATAGPDRRAVGDFLRTFSGEIVGRPVEFAADGENVHQSFFVYEVVRGAWTYRSRLTAGPRSAAAVFGLLTEQEVCRG